MATETRAGPLKYAAAIVWSYVESWYRYVVVWVAPQPVRRNGHERRRNPRGCVLCGGPMQRDRRPPRDMRGPNGQIRRLPEEILSWHKCGRCHQSQVGILT